MARLFARRPLGLAGGAGRALRHFEIVGQAVQRAVGGDQRVLDLGEAIALSQALRRGARRAGGAPEPVPAPQPAIAADQPLPGLQLSLQLGRLRRILDNADLRQPPPQRRRRLDMRGERGDAGGQRRRRVIIRHAVPMDRRRLVERRVQIIA